jgi:hypothetical protein
MSRPHDDPPSAWASATSVGYDVYWRYDPDLGPAGGVESIITWHWCTRQPPDPDDVGDGRWAAAHVGKHTLVNADPLHLEPSLLWPCCGKHGFIREGRWTNA